MRLTLQGFALGLDSAATSAKEKKALPSLRQSFASAKPKRITRSTTPAARHQQHAEPISRLVGFRSAYVFDVAQTEGQDLPAFATVKGNPAQHLERLKTLTASHSITIDYDASIAPARGVSRGGRITLMPNMPAAEEFSTLVHELSHEKLHRTDRRAETTKTIRETEAEAVAFVVCHAIGLDTNTAAADLH
jgi:hypothetical protein